MISYNLPAMSRSEFAGRVKAFIDTFPDPVNDPAGMRGPNQAAAEILALLGEEAFRHNDVISGEDWMTFWSKNLPKEAAMLGAAILGGDVSADPQWLNFDVTGVPEHYRKPLEHFMEQFVYIMSTGRGKGYRIWNSLGPDGWGWLSREVGNKIGEAKEDLENGDHDHAGKALAKIATSAFCIYAAYTWYSNLPKWFEDGYLDERAIEILDELDPDEHSPQTTQKG